MEGGGGVSSGPPRRNCGRICAELWYSEPTWTENSAYWTVPFLDFWVLEWYWNYNWLFWKLMEGIGCWIVGCIPSECFEQTPIFFLNKWGEIISTFEFVDFLVTSIFIGEWSERENLLKMNILCANFFDKSAYWEWKISLGKIIGGGGGTCPLPPSTYAHARLLQGVGRWARKPVNITKLGGCSYSNWPS